MAQINSVTDLSQDGEIAVITLNSPPVNALSLSVLIGLFDAFTAAFASDAKAVVLICDGRTFIAGADIAAVGTERAGPSLRELHRLMVGGPKLTVAAIHGTALGGGLETALCCNYRVAVPSAKVGLPEVLLGILPGAGGTQRLPRLVGVETALELVTSGRHVPAKEALGMGLLDALVEEGKLRDGALAFARKALAEKMPLRRVQDSDEKLADARARPEIFAEFRTANARKFRGFMAPEYNIRAIEAAVNLPFAEGAVEERRLFTVLTTGLQSKAQRYAFFAERAAQKIPVPDDTAVLDIKSVGVMGAGTMGGGIAMNFANIGIPVTLLDMKQENLDRGLLVIRKNYENTAKRGGMSAEQVEQRMALITGTLDMQDFAQVDLVIEAVFEDMAVKKDVFAKLDAVCKPGAILASNTSYLDLNEIASVTQRPDSVIGMHFFSPANVMKLLEVVRGAKTSPQVVATVMKLAKKIGKVGVLAGVCYGFIANRVMRKRSEQAEALVRDGAKPADVDRVIYDFGFPMGPFAMIDLVGLDVIKDAPGTRSLRGELAAAGRLGQKGVGGFYNYDDKRNSAPSPEADALIEGYRARLGLTPRQVSDQEILERCIYLVINEGAKVLEEGIALRASDIDIALIFGYAWPVFTGGPMFYAEKVGLDKVLAALKGYQARLGDEFKPAPLLEKLVAEGKTFSDLK
jgi:3-hydroxyacyl-CoA dehydrogenase